MSKIAEFQNKSANPDHEVSQKSCMLHHAGSSESTEELQKLEPFRLGLNLSYWDPIEVAMFLEEIGMESYQEVN
jgi:hypothetical protein